jgi:hypothetical protein
MKSALVAQALWDQLWLEYSQRVPYAQIYQGMIAEAGGSIANDHIAFRSLGMIIETAIGPINLGIGHLEPVLKRLGYVRMGELSFPTQNLYARHYGHPLAEKFELPKLFVSELQVDQCPPEVRSHLETTVQHGLDLEGILEFRSALEDLGEINSHPTDLQTLAHRLKSRFVRPWMPPLRSHLEAVNRWSQYGAWVLLHGYAVNHFTGYVNAQNTPAYPDIETTAQGLRNRGVPMKAAIEGSATVGLRQTATQAIEESVTVRDRPEGDWIKIPWTYAYYEIAERFAIAEAASPSHRFEGFLGPNAAQLFEMTRSRETQTPHG